MSLLEEIMTFTGLGQHDLYRIVASAPVRYKVYTIPKRSGGIRTIAQPSRELKLLQRFIVDRVLSQYPVHDCAAAYVSGKSIAHNASTHLQSRYLLKLDFKDYFPSMVVDDWRRLFSQNSFDIERKYFGLLANILFWGQGGVEARCLSIGAPSSPMLSNILMFDLDRKISEVAMSRGVSYTRYADDITLSGETTGQILSVESAARMIVARSKSPQLVFNESKRGLYAMGQKRMVTGLILTPDGNVSIGRDRKRMISSLIHRYTLNSLGMDDIGRLKGYLAFALSVEGTFVESMRTKYGADVVRNILKTHIPKKRTPTS